MPINTTLNRYFEPRKDYGAIFLRLIIGWRLIHGTQDNVFSWERMLEFRDFLEQHQVMYPLLAANVSVWAQFISGILFLLGAFTRAVAVVMIINFIAALLIVHIGLSFLDSFDAIMMLFASVFFLFNGAGKFSVDHWLNQRNKV
jgi:putative oxidoreductase